MLDVSVDGSLITTPTESTHPLPSVTITVYGPAHNPRAIALVCALGSFHKKLYGAVPPEAEPVTSPSHIPLQLTLFESLILANNAVGSEMTTIAVSEQPLTSTTAKLKLPAQSPVAVKLICAPGSSHK